MIQSRGNFATSNAILQTRGRHINMDILVGVGDNDCIISHEKGCVIDVRARLVTMESGVFAIRAAEEVWAKH